MKDISFKVFIFNLVDEMNKKKFNPKQLSNEFTYDGIYVYRKDIEIHNKHKQSELKDDFQTLFCDTCFCVLRHLATK